MRKNTLVPDQDAPPLRSPHIRILWAAWHLATLFGWAVAAMLLQVALAPASLLPPDLVPGIAAYAGSALLVLVGTRGRHPGWIALALVAVLIGAASAPS